MKELGKELNIDFFNRLKIWSEDEHGQIKSIPFKQISDFPSNRTYNQLVEKVGDLDSNFKIYADHYLKQILNASPIS